MAAFWLLKGSRGRCIDAGPCIDVYAIIMIVF